MLVQLVNKQRQAARVVETALINAGIARHSVCVSSNNKQWLGEPEITPTNNQEYAIFIYSPSGSNTEPYFETGKSLVEVVRRTIDSIRGKNSAKSNEKLEVAPF